MADPIGLKLDIGGTLPGEALLIKILDVYEKRMANMDEETRKGLDRLYLAMLKGWHNQWIAWGWPGEKV